MPTQKMVERPESFDMLVWDGTNDAELEGFHPPDSSGGYWRISVTSVQPSTAGENPIKIAVVTNWGQFVQAVPLRPGLGIYFKFSEYVFVDSAGYEPYEDVFVTPAP